MEAIATASGVRTQSRNFYVWMAGGFLAVAFCGFIPTYWAKVATGSFHAARNQRLGFGDAALHFSAVTLTAWPLMAVIFTLAIVKIRKPKAHKRLMTLLMIGMMTPAIARVFLTLFAPPGAVGPPPPFVALPPSIAADLFLVVAVVRDWRLLGRPHPVYLFGGAALVAQQLLTGPIGSSSAWVHIAKAFASLAG
jgi:hypothetical protein